MRPPSPPYSHAAAKTVGMIPAELPSFIVLQSIKREMEFLPPLIGVAEAELKVGTLAVVW